MFSVNIDDTKTGVDIGILSKDGFTTSVPTADASAKAMTIVKGPDSRWISSTWKTSLLV